MLRLPESWVEALNALAAEHRLTAVELVRTCVEIGLGLPDGAMSRACPSHTSAARQRYRALATEAERRAEVARCEAVLRVAKKRAALILQRAGKEAKHAHRHDERVRAPISETLEARRDRHTAEELLAGAQVALREAQDARSYAAQERAEHRRRLRQG